MPSRIRFMMTRVDTSTTGVEGIATIPSISTGADDGPSADTSASSSGAATEVSTKAGFFIDPYMYRLTAEVPKTVKTASTTPSTPAEKCDEALLDEAKELLNRFQASTGVVRITIPSAKSFLVHIDLLAEKSAYFHAALIGDFQEAATKQLILEDVSDNTFAFFLKWLYGQDLRPTFSHKTCSHCSECSLSWGGLFELWFFADYTCTSDLQNHIIQNLVQKIENFQDACNTSNPVNQVPIHALVNKHPQDQINQVRAAVGMIWNGKKRTPHGQIAKPLRDLLLDFVGNRRYMTKTQDANLRKTGLPYGFWYEFGLRCVDRNFDVEERTEELLSLTNPFDSEEEDSDFAFENMVILEEKTEELLDVWKIRPEKYFVKDGGKTKDTKKP